MGQEEWSLKFMRNAPEKLLLMFSCYWVIPPEKPQFKRETSFLFIFMLHTQVHYIGGTIVIAITTL
jgi:hypothetical protein